MLAMVQWLSAVLLLLAVYGFTSEDVECLGKLPNGLTYYIKKNTFPKEKATLRLVVKVGSLYETEDECGVAHFLEHMAFRGSKHFSNDEITTYLNGIGASLSPDANAYTTFEQTVYVLNVPQEELAKGILLLSDIAGRFSYVEIRCPL